MKPRMLQLLVSVFLMGTWHLAEALEPFKPYDTFEVGPISPDRWLGNSFGTGAAFQSSHLYEGHRSIIMDPSGIGRVLRILSRSYGRTDSNDGFTYGAYALAFKNSDTVTAIRAKVKVLSVVTKGCSLNASFTHTSSRAEIFGWFFNTGTTPPTDPQDSTNDVLAIVHLTRDSDFAPNVVAANASVFQCLDHDCFEATGLGGVDLGLATVGQWVRLLMQWDRDNSRFIFQRDSQAPQFVSYQNMVEETGPAHVPLKRIDVANFVPNCMGPARPVADMNALFDNVAVNESAIP
jgi:hypothetical protein